MAEGKCANCARYLLIFFNLIFWIIGMVMIGMGIWIIASEDSSQEIKSLIHLQVEIDLLENVAYSVIGVGAFMFVIGFFGCCGAIRESAIMLGVYMILLVILFLGEVAAIIYLVLEKSTLESIVRKQLHKDVRNYTGDAASKDDTNFTNARNDSAMDFLQIKFSCCGSDNFSDYRTSYLFQDQYSAKKFSSDTLYVPDSCCSSKTRAIPAKPVDREACQRAAWEGLGNDNNLHAQGCFTILKDLIDDNGAVLIGISAGIICLEILVLAFAIFLCRNRTYYDYDYDD